MKERIAYLDALKGGAILLMVMGHVLAWSFADPSVIAQFDINQPVNVKVGGAICQVIYSFHMALFFMISGFLLYKEELPLFKDFLTKKITRLLLPWLFSFGIAYLVRGSLGFWFLLSLFEISILGYLLIALLSLTKKRYFIIDLVVVLCLYLIVRKLAGFSLYGLELGMFAGYWIPFCAGILMRKYERFFILCVKNNTMFTLWVVLFVSLFACRYFVDHNSICSFLFKHSKLVLPLLGSFICWHLFSSINSERVTKLFGELGKKSLPIYILHILFVLQITAVGKFILGCNPVTSITLQLTYGLLVSLLAIVWSLLLYNVLSRSNLISKFLFGE